MYFRVSNILIQTTYETENRNNYFTMYEVSNA